MSENGYIKLHRRIIESQVFINEGLFQVWVWCLLKTNHKENWVKVDIGQSVLEVKVFPGQFIFGRYSAKQELRKMSPSTIWNRMKKLEKIGNLNIQSNSHYSVITIINWDTYQTRENNVDSQDDYRLTADRQPIDTNKNDKNEKKNTLVIPFQGIVDLYHEILPIFPSVAKLSDKRKSQLKARWLESESTQSLDWWRGFFESVKGSRFLTGNNDRGWKPDLEWMTKQENFLKICEGKYN